MSDDDKPPIQYAYANVYDNGVGGCIGFIYRTREDAEAAATKDRSTFPLRLALIDQAKESP